MYCRNCLYPLKEVAAGLAARRAERERDDDEAAEGTDRPAGERCPECGTSFDPGRPESYVADRRALASPLFVVLLVCAAYPIVWLLLAGATMLCAAAELGQWPGRASAPMHDEGAVLGTMTALLFFSALPACPTVIMTPLAAVAVLIERPRGWWWAAPLAALTWAGAYALVAIDPGGSFEWLAD